ncbi:MAG: nicotinamide mononucleotide transporter [Frankiales bacterium]|nr:nicotinamide mononucleotide transporter [Frankiales bacterium]
MAVDTVRGVLTDLVAPFNETIVVTVAGTPSSLGEVLGFVTGAACVYGVATQRLWNWPVGLANNGFFLILFLAAGLYADSALQVVFAALAAYGWWAWLRGGQAGADLQVTTTSRGQWLMLLACGLAGTTALTGLLAAHTASTVPLADAVTTVLSLQATWGQCRKKVESWYLWIVADAIYVPLYAYKHLALTSVLYVGFAALCVIGLRAWRAELAAGRRASAALPLPLAA